MQQVILVDGLLLLSFMLCDVVLNKLLMRIETTQKCLCLMSAKNVLDTRR